MGRSLGARASRSPAAPDDHTETGQRDTGAPGMLPPLHAVFAFIATSLTYEEKLTVRFFGKVAEEEPSLQRAGIQMVGKNAKWFRILRCTRLANTDLGREFYRR